MRIFLIAALFQLVLARERRVLYQSDFANGTYRIQTPGEYVLGEDIKFGPRPDLNWWNPFADPKYPGGSFYLGFFAAITIETSDVTLDLNGKTLECSKPFYLLQRFFNLIELGDRVFIEFEGVSSLNYQVGDKVQFQPSLSYPPLAVASKVVIKNGRLGLSSHNGIHGMGANDVTIMNLVVENFEVAGIQCNGCTDVKIRNVIVGPNSRQVPSTAQFSSARFLDRYTNDFIPYGFALEPLVSGLDLVGKNNITFADRPNQVYTLKRIFERLRIGVELYQRWYFAQVGFNNTVFNENSLNAEEKEIWRDAYRLFFNRHRIPDGSAVYGVFLNRFGASVDFFGANDENYYGGETKNVQVQNLKIKDLTLKMTTVVTLVTESGEVIQGPARDSLRLYDMTNNQLTDFKTSTYKGNFLSDAYFAFWKLSTLFYNARVFESACGSFPSNATFPWGYWSQPCPLTRKAEPTFNGRDSAILQKRFFGGLLISQDLYDWATIPGTKLERVLESDADPITLRRTRHSLVCNTDTMFHEGKGVVGFRADFSDGVRVSDLEISNLTNFGDMDTWECNLKAEFSTGEARMVESFSVEPRAHVNVRGIEIGHTRDVRLSDIDISGLNSEEGAVFGIDIRTDNNDASDYASGNLKYSFNDIDVKNLIGGAGSMVTPLRMDSVNVDLRQFETGAVPTLQNNFKVPRAMMYAGFLTENTNSLLTPENPDVILSNFKLVSQYKTDEAVIQHRNKLLGYLENQFGLEAPVFQDNKIFGSLIYPQSNMFGYWNLLSTSAITYSMPTFCFNDAAFGESPSCTPPSNSTRLFDISLVLAALTPGSTVHGVYGGDEGKYLDSTFTPVFLTVGTYTIEGVTWNGVPQDNLEVEFYGSCPFIYEFSKAPVSADPPLSVQLNCDLRSDVFGRGKAEGNVIINNNPYTGRRELRTDVVWTFDNTHEERKTSGVRTMNTAPNGIAGNLNKLTIAAQANGVLHLTPAMAGNSLWSFPPAMHFQNEAGTKFMRRWLNFNDAQILSLRNQFSAYMSSVFGVAANWAPTAPLENSLDLAGTTTCFPYELNHDSNLRWMYMFDDRTTARPAPLDARIHEGGFMCRVGRMGLGTSHGWLSYGTVIQYGYFVLENFNGPNNHLTLRFENEFATIRNLAKMSTVAYKVQHPTLGWGLAKAFLDEYKPADNGGTKVNHKIVFSWN